MKRPAFYVLYLLLLVLQQWVLLFSLDLSLSDWRWWAIMMTTILGAAALAQAYS